MRRRAMLPGVLLKGECILRYRCSLYTKSAREEPGRWLMVVVAALC